MMKTIYSVTIAVEDLDQAVKNYEEFLGIKPSYSSGYEVLFTECGLREIGIDQKDQIAVFDLPGIRFILLTGFDNTAPIGRFIRRKGEGVFMISMAVENIRKEADRLRKKGKKLVLSNNIEGNFGSINIVHPNDMNGVLFELIEPSENFKK